MTKTTLTLIPCPSWCTVDHADMPPGARFHAGGALSAVSAAPMRLWQADQQGVRPGVVVAGEVLSEAEAHELGMALVRAGDVLRREANR